MPRKIRLYKNDFFLTMILLTYGVNIYSAANISADSDSDDEPELLLAIKSEKLDKVKSLIESKADVNDYNYKDYTKQRCILQAIRTSQPEIAKLIIAAPRFDPNQTDRFGTTAIMVAATRNYTDLVRSLIEKGADINMYDDQGTALRRAAYFGANIDTFRLLLYAGAIFNNTSKSKTIIEELKPKLGNSNIDESDKSKVIAIIELLENEPTRRENVLTAYFGNKIAKNITILPDVISKIIGHYAVAKDSLSYTDIPLVDRLAIYDKETNNDTTKSKTGN